MSVSINLYPTTETTLAALRFCESPFIHLHAALQEIGIPGQIPIDEQAAIVLERSGKLLESNRDKLYLSAFCLISSPEDLQLLMTGTLANFERKARSATVEAMPAEAFDALIKICFAWFGRQVAITGKGDE